MVGALTSMSRRELDRLIDRYPWFTSARRARALQTGGEDEALTLPLLFWPTVAPVLVPPPVPPPEQTAEPIAGPLTVPASTPELTTAPAHVSAHECESTPATDFLPEGAFASVPELASENVIADAPASENVVSDVSSAPSVPADELIDRFINHGGYRIAPDGEAAEARVDVEIAPEMVTPQLAAIYRSQGLVAEAERIDKILNSK